MSYKHIVYSEDKTIRDPKPIKEITTNIKFASVKQASQYFKLDGATIAKSANNRSKRPQHPYKFEWIKEVRNETMG